MSKVLILFAHPDQSQSCVNTSMASAARELDDVTVADLYAEYPRYKIEPEKEQQRLLEHDVVVLQFPFYWYSTPSILKEWMDGVLEYGFAYGHEGDKLANKPLLVATTAGGSEDAYSTQGSNQFPIRTLLSPLEQTANLCQMPYLPPFVLFGSLAASQDQRLTSHINHYRELLISLRDDQLEVKALSSHELMSESLLSVSAENPADRRPRD